MFGIIKLLRKLYINVYIECRAIQTTFLKAVNVSLKMQHLAEVQHKVFFNSTVLIHGEERRRTSKGGGV